MKKRLVRLCFKLGWHRLAYHISPSTYYQLVVANFIKQFSEAHRAMAAFMSAVSAASPSSQGVTEDRLCEEKKRRKQNDEAGMER